MPELVAKATPPRRAAALVALAACACVGAIVVLQQSSTGDVVAALSAVNVAAHLGSSRDCFLAYCNAHGDLRNALCDGGICSSDTHLTRCTDHWRRHGKSEGRHSNPEQCMLTADQCFLAYCNAHGDLQNALCGGGTCSSGTHLSACSRHWRVHGKGEGRHTNPEQCMSAHDPCFFAYCNAHGDLMDALCGGGPCRSGAHLQACARHWRVHGKGEGRHTNPEICIGRYGACFLAYCNAHGDLKTAFCGGGNCSTDAQLQECVRHWRVHGKKEGRSADPESCLKPTKEPTPEPTGLPTTEPTPEPTTPPPTNQPTREHYDGGGEKMSIVNTVFDF